MSYYIENVLQQHNNLQFPPFPEDDDFADWVSELSETDSYYVGIAVSWINMDKDLVVDKSHIGKLENDLQKFSAIKNDSDTYKKCCEYVASLKRLISFLD